MKKIIFTSIILLFAFEVFAICLPGRWGERCRERREAERREKRINTQINNYLSPALSGAGQRRRDGGYERKVDAGDKSKNQGYATYKKHFLYYAYEIYVAPHQEGFYKSSETNNRSIGYEYAFNPFISIKGQKSDLFFKGLSGDSEMKQEHLIALLNLRIYVLNDFVVRSGIGVGQSKVESKGSDDPRYNISEEGNTEVLQFSAMYIFGDENTFIGITNTTIQGSAGDKNIGSTSYGLNAGLGF